MRLKKQKRLSPSPSHKDEEHRNASMHLEGILEESFEVLRQFGLKRTPHRESLLRFLIKNHGPFSKDQIQASLSHENWDGVTLYRNLASFEEVGLVRRTEFGDGISRYEFQRSPEHHHHHIICTKCRRVDSLDSCLLPDLDKRVGALGYSNVKHSLEFFGVCLHCSSSPVPNPEKRC
ncbi:MAG: Fur family transcriptional regulator [Bdellovibrionia bacterium]